MTINSYFVFIFCTLGLQDKREFVPNCNYSLCHLTATHKQKQRHLCLRHKIIKSISIHLSNLDLNIELTVKFWLSNPEGEKKAGNWYWKCFFVVVVVVWICIQIKCFNDLLEDRLVQIKSYIFYGTEMK